MSYLKIPANERGFADYGWLKPAYSFSFSNWYNPNKMGFKSLLVLNNDIVAPAAGFPTHGHQNMEIITIPLRGSIAHKDSTGSDGIIQTGEVQIMSAGTGITHSEFNASQTEDLELFQIWILPEQNNLQPRYDQTAFNQEERQNKWQIVVSPNPENDQKNYQQQQKPLKIYQQSYLSLADIEEGKKLIYNLKNSQAGVYLMLIEGQIEINGTVLTKRDAMEITNETEFEITAQSKASVLVIETV